jgi:hypothetical protein
VVVGKPARPFFAAALADIGIGAKAAVMWAMTSRPT